MISHLQMITIYVSDLARAVDFYVNKLGFGQTAVFDDGTTCLSWVVPEAAKEVNLATEIALYAPDDPTDPRIGNVSGMVFTADDIEATYHELKSRACPLPWT